MPPNLPTKPPMPPGNQTELQLIYAIHSLAQSLELMHQDLRRLIEEEARDRDRELDQIREIGLKNSQALAVLPMTMSERFEALVRRIEEQHQKQVDGILNDVRLKINDVRNKLWDYIQEKETKEKTQTGPFPVLQEDDITGRIELTKAGKLNMSFQTAWAKKAWLALKWAVLLLAAGGGVAGAIEIIRTLLAK